jgi:hypothetical protein
MWIGWGKAVDPITHRQLESPAKLVGQACEKAVMRQFEIQGAA